MLNFAVGNALSAGYHRMWTHRAFKAAWPLRVWWAALGAGAWEGSIVCAGRWRGRAGPRLTRRSYWARFHRAVRAAAFCGKRTGAAATALTRRYSGR